MKKIVSILLLSLCLTTVMAQVPYGRTETATLFKEYCPAVIKLTAGNVLKVAKANVFLKNSKLFYKDRNNNDMEANMANIQMVVFGNRTFINHDNKLAEVIDTIGQNQLLRVLLVDIDAMKNDMLNNSNITDISGLGSSSDVLGVTRLDVDEEGLGYPLYATYYYFINGKTILCHEREVSRKISKAQREIYNIVIHRDLFSWANEDDLKNLLHELSK